MSISSEKKADLILEKWTIELRNKDRKLASVSSNFDELFEKLSDAEIEFNIVHPMVELIAKRHYPPDVVAKRSYNDLERKQGHLTYREFVDNWCNEIKAKAFESFYAFFNNEVQTTEEKKHGNMSAREYHLQRKHADSYPELTFEQLQERMKKIEVDLTHKLDLPEDDNGSSTGR